jgi:FAD dependent oxidoreductase TIGR03364
MQKSSVNEHCQVAVVGGGIVGLAQAYAAARRGMSVTVFERHAKAESASVRNFGMIWPIGVAAGFLHDSALLSRRLWVELASEASFWLRACGSMHLAREQDEQAVLEEYTATDAARDAGRILLTPSEVAARCPGARIDGLRCGLWSPSEMVVDPRQAVVAVTDYLRNRFDVRFEFDTTVTEVRETSLQSSAGETWFFDEAVVCGGAEFAALFPEVHARSGVRRCKLQMMRTVPQPNGWRIGTHVAGGATLRHYANFADCPSVQGLRQRISGQFPELDRYGIHVMASQNESGEVVIGDSHEYGDAIDPFDKPEIDRIILEHLAKIVELPDPTIARRWHGIYPRHATLAQFVHHPRENVKIVLNTNGLGMTLSFGLAEQARTIGFQSSKADRRDAAATVA